MDELIKTLEKIEKWFASEDGPLYRLWEDSDIGDYDDYQDDWPRTLIDLRNFSVDPALLGSGTEWPVIYLYREILQTLQKVKAAQVKKEAA